MKFQYGIPTEPGRYDCVFNNCIPNRQFCEIVLVGDSVSAFDQRGYPMDIKEIIQYLGPFPDPFQN